METQFIPGMDFFPLARKGAARAAVVCEWDVSRFEVFLLEGEAG